MSGGGDSTRQILQSLLANVAIAVSKAIAAAITGSGAMLAEALHSFSDCGNQLLLLFGVRRARRPPDDKHPLGHGRSIYFWSFIVALLLFTGGGVFSIHEGIHKLEEPSPVGSVRLAVIILVISLALEGWSLWSNVRELDRRRGSHGFFRHLRDTKDSDLVVVFGENFAAVVGLLFALAAIVLADATGDPRWDAGGSLAIGIVLVGVAIALANEIRSLLVGEAAGADTEQTIREIASADPNVVEVLRLLTIQQGPGEVVVALKLRWKPGLTTGDDLERLTNELEARIEAKCPDVKWTFVEPDLTD
jgi:cation diffusion facilitator family transporter